MRNLIPAILATLLCTAAVPAKAEEPLVFISAFAGGEKGGIHAFQFDTVTGALKPLDRTTGVENPFFIAVSPDKRFLYSIHAEKFGGKENEHVAAYELEGRTGRLKLLNRKSSHGTASCYLDVDATGRTVVVANYSTGSVASLPVQKDGSLGEAVSFFKHEGSGADPVRQKGPNAHSIVVSPDNRFALAADLGIDQVLSYQLDAATAKLSPNPQQAFVKAPPGAGPRHLTFHPNGKLVYVINEIKNSVTVFNYDTASGKLSELKTASTLPEGFTGKSYCADLKITPDGRILYGTNRGHDSIAVFSIAEDGGLKLLSNEPSLGKGPQNLLVTPDGKWLLCANMPGNNVVVFQIDSKTGGLKATGEPVSITMPSCIKLLP